MMNRFKIILLALALILPPFAISAQAQTKNKDILDYIEKYYPLAIKEMNKYKIPASITLAQGVFESGWGKSALAMRSNNHFGIKCKSNWDGESVYHDDDEKGECFRKYASVEDSYEDHSKFLTSNSRYAFLFELKNTDYTGWAHGLKKAGYATNPQYAQRLINLIDLYELHQYDLPLKKEKEVVVPITVIPSESIVDPYQIKKGVKIYTYNKCKYIIAESGDTWETIAIKSKKKLEKLYLFNDITDPNYQIMDGEKIYITKKQKSNRSIPGAYTAKSGETLHSISQKFAISVDPLCDLNNLYKFEKLSEGKIIRLKR